MPHLSGVSAEALSLLCLVVVLALAITRPRGLPEAASAVPAAALLLVTGAVTTDRVVAVLHELGGTVAFLAVILVLAHLCEAEGLFDYAGRWTSRRAHGSPGRLLLLVFLIASLTTAVLSLDATVVLLTPVVLATAARVGADAEPHVYATAHLANAASLLLPVSNLTNLLAFQTSGLSFGRFAVLMAVPWLLAIGLDYVVLRLRFASRLRTGRPAAGEERDAPVPTVALVVLGVVLVGFGACSALGVSIIWPAVAGAVILLVKRLLRPADAGDDDGAAPESRPGRVRHELGAVVRAANPLFLLFVLALGVVVDGAVDHGLGDLVGRVLPSSTGLLSLLGLAVAAAVAANLVNNLPATLMLVPLTAPLGPVAVLAVLIGVNVGPNLTYVGSLATLLWRRVLLGHGARSELVEFTRLGLMVVPVSLVACTTALWAAARVLGV